MVGINLLFVLVPIAWASHFMNTDGRWPHQVTFARTEYPCVLIRLYNLLISIAVCFVSIIPMENIFEWGGEQLAIYLGKDLGDLVIISLNKCVLYRWTSITAHRIRISAVEAALAIILLKKCE